MYVSPQGQDVWSGTLESPSLSGEDGPVATLQRALEIRRKDVSQGKAGADIVLREGTYHLAKTVEFTASDSGSTEHPFKISAYPGEHPVLDGGIKLSGTWKKEEGSSLWSLQLADLPHPIEDLFLNGKKLPRSRLPDSGTWRAVKLSEDGRQLQFNPGQLQAWADATNGVIIIKLSQWFEQTLPVQSADEKTETITLAKKTNYPFAEKFDPHAGECSIENLRAGVDGPGKWCFDPGQKTLLFWPPEGVDPQQAEVVAGGLPLLVSVTGDVVANHWAEHLVFDGLTFVHSGRHEATAYAKGAAFQLASGARNCEIRRCHFADLGGDGLMLLQACQDNVISGNDFTGTGGAAVRIYAYLEARPSLSSGNRVENNVIHRCCTVERTIAGINLENTRDNHIAHNLIYEMPYDGISVEGDRPIYWPAIASPGLKPPYTAAAIKPFIPTQGNVMEKNHIHHVMQEMADGGAIYLWGVMGGTNYVRNNLIEHIGTDKESCVGIYLDDECDDVTVTDNIVIDATFGLQLHGASRDLVQNNIFAYSRENDLFIQPEKYAVFPMDTVLKNNIYFDCAGDVFHDTHWAPWDRRPIKDSDYNLYWQNGTPTPLGQGTFKGFDSHSLVANPLFTGPENGDFRLKANSPALPLGIHAIDLSDVGPTP